MGDWVAYKSNALYLVYLGPITGNYVFRPQQDSDHAHTRTVKWLGSRSASELSAPLQKAVTRQNGFYKLADCLSDMRHAILSRDWNAGQ